MKFRSIFFLFAIFFLMPPTLFAQSPVDPDQVAVRLTEFPAGAVRRRIAAERPRSTVTTAGSVSIFALEKYTFDLLNEKRREQGLSALTWSEDVAKVARVHSKNMANTGVFSHRGTDGSMVDGRADESGLGEWRAIGENIAFLRGYDDPAEFAVNQWMNSAGHKRNILGDQWTQTGIGLAVTDDGSYYFTQVFLRRE